MSARDTAPSLSRVVEGFLLYKQAEGLSEYTVRNYRQALKLLVEHFGDTPLDQLTTEDLREMARWIQQEYRTPRGGRLSPKAIRNRWGEYSAFWKWVRQEYGVTLGQGLPSAPRAEVRAIEPLSMDELERLLGVTSFTEERHPPGRAAHRARRPTGTRDRSIILTMLDTGVRVSELTSAKVRDLDLTTGKWLVTGKGTRERFVYLGKVARQGVWRYLLERFPNEDPRPDEPLFACDDGLHSLNRHNVRQLLGRLGERAGVRNVHPHRLRHTFAIEYLRNGGDIFTLQRILGHSSLDMVRHYLALAQLDMENAHRRASPADRWRLR